MKILLLFAILTAAWPVYSQDESFNIRAIDFYGLDGLNVNRIRAALPLREGDRLSRDSKEKTVGQLKEAIKQATGHGPSDIAIVCCDDQGRLMLYIGLSENSVGQALYNLVPRGLTRLPPAATKVHREADQAWMNAMAKGVSGEDDSRGYALSVDPEARAKQVALHTYVARHSTIVRRVLASARDVEQRRIAAEMLGYAVRSRKQIRALIHASRDIDEGVRNNAMRALIVLARSNAEASALIPGECFVRLLNSGVWTDRNKSAELLAVRTRQRDPQLIACLGKEALTSLIEMARWSYPGHAYSAQLMLGRIVGIDEKTLIGMIERQEVEPLINAVTTQQNNGKIESQSCPVCK